MSVTDQQKYVIDCIISIFETGKIPAVSSYSTCTILKDGAGISYGKHQSTDRAGSLDKIVKRYISEGGKLGPKLVPFIPRLAANETTLIKPDAIPAWGQELIGLLREAGADPVMRAAQDSVFDEDYWNPAVKHAQDAGLKTALGYAVIYDTCIHSGPGRVKTHRAAFPQKSPANGGEERAWVQAYVATRKAWLLDSPNPLVQKTIYRMEAFEELIRQGNWSLTTPLTVRGKRIS